MSSKLCCLLLFLRSMLRLVSAFIVLVRTQFKKVRSGETYEYLAVLIHVFLLSYYRLLFVRLLNTCGMLCAVWYIERSFFACTTYNNDSISIPYELEFQWSQRLKRRNEATSAEKLEIFQDPISRTANNHENDTTHQSERAPVDGAERQLSAKYSIVAGSISTISYKSSEQHSSTQYESSSSLRKLNEFTFRDELPYSD